MNTISGFLCRDVVFGANIGAAQLDSLSEAAVLERLSQLCSVGGENQNAKCDYGSEESLVDTDTFAVRVPKSDPSYTNSRYEISGGDMYLRRDDLKGNFNEQNSKLFEMMDKQLVRLQQLHPNEQVAHLVLSGGLGNSAFVQSCPRPRYTFGNSTHSNVRGIQVRVAPDPHLVKVTLPTE